MALGVSGQLPDPKDLLLVPRLCGFGFGSSCCWPAGCNSSCCWPVGCSSSCGWPGCCCCAPSGGEPAGGGSGGSGSSSPASGTPEPAGGGGGAPPKGGPNVDGSGRSVKTGPSGPGFTVVRPARPNHVVEGMRPGTGGNGPVIGGTGGKGLALPPLAVASVACVCSTPVGGAPSWAWDSWANVGIPPVACVCVDDIPPVVVVARI